MLDTPPALDPLAQQAAHCWAFCGGWHPEHWPMYDALYGCADWLAVAELMQHIRNHHD